MTGWSTVSNIVLPFNGETMSGIIQLKRIPHSVVTKISSCLVYVISWQGIWKEQSISGSIFFLFPMKVAGGHAFSNLRKTPTPGP